MMTVEPVSSDDEAGDGSGQVEDDGPGEED